MRQVGLQINTKYLFTSTSTFIAVEDVREVVIHEGFIGLQVKFYLAIIVHQEGRLHIAFRHVLPRRRDLQVVYRTVHGMLYL